MENYGILLVDDEVAYHAMLSAVLTPLGCSVNCVRTPDAALEAIAASRYDLIFMDIELGDGVDGYTAAARLRADGANWIRDCPIIAFTTLKAVGGEAHFQDRGLDGLLVKPFTAADVIAAARRWLGREFSLSPAKDNRLAALLGDEAAGEMVARLFASLDEAIAAIDAGAPAAGFGHKLGGLAGTLGFPVLSAAWLALQNGDSASWATVRALTLEATATT